MGYRNYFYLVSKATAQLLHSYELPKKNIDDEYVSLTDDLLGGVCVHEFGKIAGMDLYDEIMEYASPLFPEGKASDYYEEYYPQVIGKQSLLAAIEWYRGRSLGMYQRFMSLPLDSEPHKDAFIREIRSHMAMRVIDWGKPYDPEKTESEHCLPDSWQYDYQFFALVHLYHSIDWDTQCLVFVGY